MGPVWSLARTEMRSRWVALVGLGLIVALATGVIVTAVVGARRTSTVLERFRDWSVASDATVQSDTTENGLAMADTVGDLPYVEASTTRFLVNGFPAGADESGPDFALYSDPSGHYGVDIDRPRVLRGRMPAADAPDEIVLDELAARLLARGVGDHVDVSTWTREDLDALFGGTSFPGFNGPQLDLTVVGVVRTPDGLQGNVERASLIALAGPDFLAAHPGVGAWPPVVAVRVDDPKRDLPVLAESVGAVSGVDRRADLESATDTYIDATQRSVNALSTGLWVFALVAGAAGLVVITQAMSRQVAASRATTPVTRALGLTRVARSLATGLPLALATVFGVLAGLAIAVVVSQLLPTGLARRAEVSPGIWIDGVAMAGAALLALAILLGWVVFVSWRSQRPDAGAPYGSRRPSVVADRLANLGLPPTVATGIRFAFESRDRRSTAGRSAFAAGTIAIVGILGAGVVVASLDALSQDSTRWGWNWSSEPDSFGETDPTEKLVGDDRLAAVAVGTANTVEISGQRVPALAVTPLKGSVPFTIDDGRTPDSPSEMAVGRETMQDLGFSLGDNATVLSADTASTVEMTVVGTVVNPNPTNPGVGAIFTPDGLERVQLDEPESNLVLRYPDGVDAAELERQLTEDYELSFPLFAHAQVPSPIRNVDQGRAVAIALAIFFSLIGMAGLLHALTVSTRGRRRDFAVLRAIGLRGRQLREVVTSQSLAIAAVSLVVGIPLGLIVGRAFWRQLLDGVGVLDWPTTPWLLVAVAIPAALAVAIVVAWLPARTAVRVHPSQLLRGD